MAVQVHQWWGVKLCMLPMRMITGLEVSLARCSPLLPACFLSLPAFSRQHSWSSSHLASFFREDACLLLLTFSYSPYPKPSF